MTLLRMLAFRPAAAGNSAPAGTGGAARQDVAKPVPAPAPKAVKAKAAPHKPVTWKDPNWKELVPRLGLSGAERLLAGSCAFLRRENNTVFFSLDPGSESYLTRQRKEALACRLSDHYGEPLAVDISIGVVEEVESPMRAENREADENFAAERAKLEADPNVQALKDMFGAELNPESIKLNTSSQD